MIIYHFVLSIVCKENLGIDSAFTAIDM